MSFTKSQLQAMRSLLTRDIHQLSHLAEYYRTERRANFNASDILKPEGTGRSYRLGKKMGNKLVAIEKKLVKKELLLKAVKKEIQEVDKPKMFDIWKFGQWVKTFVL